MSSKYNKGDKVEWKWGNGTAEGKVQEVHHQKISRKINGSEINREGSKENPALVIEQSNGQTVLKLSSELS